MRIGILQCDTVAPELQPDFGDYPDMFHALLGRGAADIEFRDYDLTADELPHALDVCDAWLFTGSKWSAYDPDAWIQRAHELARNLHRERRPTVGICFGHQLIARALGGRVERARSGWGVGVHTARIRERRPWMTPARDGLPLLVSHQDQVTEPAPGSQVLAGHAFCPYDMTQIGEHILTLQGHPEFAVGYSRATMERRRQVLGEETFRAGVASLDQPVESDVAAAWILRFLRAAQQRRAA
jgi:GMP synthase-like glutamine amidotransferase